MFYALGGILVITIRAKFLKLEELKIKGAALFASGKSAQARGITKDQLESLGFTPATPNKLVELTFEADRVLIY